MSPSDTFHFARMLAYVPSLLIWLKAAVTGPESADSEEGAVVLLAESKLDGSPIGTMRIQTNDF